MSSSQNTISIDEIRSGDLLAWKRDSHSTFSDILIHGIRLLTFSKYGHVGIAWRVYDVHGSTLFVIEASFPRIKVSVVNPDGDFDCVPMDTHWSGDGKKYLTSKLGLAYGLMDAIRGFLGIRLQNDKRFQCAELAHWYYYKELDGWENNSFIPDGLVKSAERFTGKKIHRVKR